MYYEFTDFSRSCQLFVLVKAQPLNFEKFLFLLQPFFQKDLIEAGCDEAGRGCLAGPVFAAAVILPKGFSHPVLNDSKQLTEQQRYELRGVIESNAVAYAIASIDNNEIDHINILKASIKAMHLAIEALKITPELLLIDGNRFIKYKRIPHHCIIKGDATYMSIAAASVLAKTYRDELMLKLHNEFPQYGWNTNKGYGTIVHRKAIEQHGSCKYHRMSFRLIPEQEELF